MAEHILKPGPEDKRLTEAASGIDQNAYA